MTKYAANAMLATKISFINEVANLCERTGGTISTMCGAASATMSVSGFQFLFPGVGFGVQLFSQGRSGLQPYTAKQKGVPFLLMEGC